MTTVAVLQALLDIDITPESVSNIDKVSEKLNTVTSRFNTAANAVDKHTAKLANLKRMEAELNAVFENTTMTATELANAINLLSMLDAEKTKTTRSLDAAYQRLTASGQAFTRTVADAEAKLVKETGTTFKQAEAFQQNAQRLQELGESYFTQNEAINANILLTEKQMAAVNALTDAQRRQLLVQQGYSRQAAAFLVGSPPGIPTYGAPPPFFGTPGGANVGGGPPAAPVPGGNAPFPAKGGGAAAGAGDHITRLGFQTLAAIYTFQRFADIIVEASEKTLEFNRSVELMSVQLGISTDAAAGFLTQAEALGISTDTVTEAYRTFADRLGRAEGLFGEPTKGSKAMAEAMRSLGIQTRDADGKLRPMDQLLPEIFDKFQELGPGIKTTALATALFGQRADELLPVLIRGREGFEEYAEFARKAGLALTPRQVELLRDFQEQQVKIGLATQGLFSTLGQGIAEGGYLSGFADFITGINQGFIDLQTTIVFFGSITEQTFIEIGRIVAGYIELFTTGSREGFDFAFESLRSAQDILAEAESKASEFLKSRTGGAGQPAFPFGEGAGEDGEDSTAAREDALEKLADLYKRFAENAQELALELERMERDHNIRSERETEDYLIKRARDVEDYNNDLQDKYAQLYDDLDQAQSDFDTKQAQDRADYNRDRLNRITDFENDNRNRLADFEIKRYDQEQDYNIKRARAVEDYNQKVVEAEAKYQEQRRDLIDKHNQEIANLQAKWDQILLRLRVGGDRDSIVQAEAAAAAAVATEVEKNDEELASFEEKRQKQAEADQADFELKQRRAEEDFRLDQERKKRDFESDQEQRTFEFQAEMNRRDEEFKIKFARAEADFGVEQARKQERIQIDQDADARAFALKLQREDEDHNLEALRREEDYQRRREDRIEDYNLEQADLIQQINELLAIAGEGQSSMTQANRTGSTQRIANAVAEHNALIAIYTDLEQQRSRLSNGTLYTGPTGSATPNRDFMDSIWATFLASMVGSGVPGRAFGGQVPGPLGSPRLVMAHGGETYIPPSNPSYYSNVRHGDTFSASQSNTFNISNPGNVDSMITQASRSLSRNAILRRGMSNGG